MEAVTASDAAGLLAEVRKLHGPVWYDPMTGRNEQVWLVCRGCDEGAHSESPADWPCSTAAIVYTDEEIAARGLPSLPDCPDHPGRPVIARRAPSKRGLVAARWMCEHIAPVAFASPDPYEWGIS